METKEQREQVILDLVNMLRVMPFTMKFKVKKKPKGIHIVYDVTREVMDAMIKEATEKEKKSVISKVINNENESK